MCLLEEALTGETAGPTDEVNMQLIEEGNSVVYYLWIVGALSIDMVAEFVRHHDLDVICFQEPHEYQTREIASRLPEYAYFGRGRNRDGSSEYQPIFWKKNRFSQLNNGCFWLSETPHVPESMGWDAVCTRQTVWTILHDTQSMRDILFLNTHWDHVGITARTSSARVVIETQSRAPLS
jgi:endonuclease/exonuclease/phosphatase family metal-dependent hydrolase